MRNVVGPTPCQKCAVPVVFDGISWLTPSGRRHVCNRSEWRRLKALRETGPIAPRPITYRGVEFRSSLEAKFAQHLDQRGEKWAYEPRPYGTYPNGYLPDFQIIGATHPTFIEVKPTLEEVEPAQRKMRVIWAAHPDATLIVACAEGCSWSVGRLGEGWIDWQERWAA